jgi:hypothetical protein
MPRRPRSAWWRACSPKGAKGLIDQWRGGGGMSLPIQAAGVDDLALEDVEDKIRAKATVK